MDNFDKMAGRGGSFILNAGDNTASGMQNVIGSKAGFWAFIALESGSTLSTLEDGGATCFGSGTTDQNYGINVAASYEWPVNVLITASSMEGFTKMICATGSFLVYRMHSVNTIEANLE